MSHLHLAPCCARRVVFSRKALVLLCGGTLMLAPQAALVSAPDDLLQGNGLAASSAGGSVLQRSLTVDTQSGQRNLDLLLEARTAGAAVGAAEPSPGRASALLPAAPPRLLSADSTDAAMQRQWLGVAPGGVGLGGRAEQDDMPGAPMAVDGLGRSRPLPDSEAGQDTDAGLRGTAIMDLARVLREYRYWLVGALAGVGLLAASRQAFGRRSPPRQPVWLDPAVHTTAQDRSRSRRRQRR